MGMEVAGSCFRWSQPLRPPNPSPTQTIASVFSSLRRGNSGSGCDHSLIHQTQTGSRSPFLGTSPGRLSRRRSLDTLKGRGEGRRIGEQTLRRAFSASLQRFDDEDEDEDEDEFVTRLQELAMSLGQESTNDFDIFAAGSTNGENADISGRKSPDASSSSSAFSPFSVPPPRFGNGGHEPAYEERLWQSICSEPPDWPDLIPASVVRNANSVELPLSLRMIKRRKKQLEEGFREAGESACSSVKKAFSSMVFIIQEIQSYTLHMRELLFPENLQGILSRVQGELHASFVWLFQHIFSCTPTLMLFLMLLLANFAVYSMGHSTATAIAASTSPSPQSVVVTVAENQQQSRFDHPSSISRSFSVGGSGEGGGGGKVRPLAGATDDGSSSSYNDRRTVIPQGISTAPATKDDAAAVVTEEEVARVWSGIVEEASRMQAAWRGDEALMDPEILQRFVSPVTVEVEPEDESTYVQTEFTYHQALLQDPDNVLLLTNFAQFLFLVLHDHDRAEYFFKRAVRIEPVDAESLSLYAKFLWLARKDLGAAEETYLEAIAADPGNSFHAANYAHFLWSTGGEDTCYPLDGSDDV